MKIQLVGFDFAINANHKIDIFKEIVNNSDADLILFPGHTLRDEEDVHYLCMHLENTKPTVVFELEKANPTSCMHTNNDTAEGIQVETIVDPILYGKLKEQIIKEF